METDNNTTLASEIYADLKSSIKFLKFLVVLLLAALILTNAYHIYQWSQFETIVVDSGDGNGNANCVIDNSGGSFVG